jgi:hypothetical protein
MGSFAYFEQGTDTVFYVNGATNPTAMAKEPPHLPPEPMYVAKVQRCGLREALFAHFDRPKGSFPPKRARFPVLVALLEPPGGT